MKMWSIRETDMDSGREREWTLVVFGFMAKIFGVILSLYTPPVILNEGKDAPLAKRRCRKNEI